MSMTEETAKNADRFNNPALNELTRASKISDFRASDAKALSRSKAITITDAMGFIKRDAESGHVSSMLPFNRIINEDVIPHLINKGFSVRKHADPFNGFESYIISW